MRSLISEMGGAGQACTDWAEEGKARRKGRGNCSLEEQGISVSLDCSGAGGDCGGLEWEVGIRRFGKNKWFGNVLWVILGWGNRVRDFLDGMGRHCLGGSWKWPEHN